MRGEWEDQRCHCNIQTSGGGLCNAIPEAGIPGTAVYVLSQVECCECRRLVLGFLGSIELGSSALENTLRHLETGHSEGSCADV